MSANVSMSKRLSEATAELLGPFGDIDQVWILVLEGQGGDSTWCEASLARNDRREGCEGALVDTASSILLSSMFRRGPFRKVSIISRYSEESAFQPWEEIIERFDEKYDFFVGKEDLNNRTELSIVDKTDSSWSGNVRESIYEFSKKGVFEQDHLDAWMYKMWNKDKDNHGKRRKNVLPSLRYQCVFCSQATDTEITFCCHLHRHENEIKADDFDCVVGNVVIQPKEPKSKPEREFGKRTKRKKRKVAEVERDMRLQQLKKKRKAVKGKKVSGGVVDDLDDAREGTVEAVKTLLEITREERIRRGKYLKYRHEQRDEMAEYAIAHGVTEAARHHSEQTGTQIKASTIRNFVRSYQQHPEELKLEVGRRAYQFGSDKCLAQMLQRGDGVGTGLNRTLVHRFMWVYLRKNPTLPVGPPDSGREEMPTQKGRKTYYSDQLKDEMGRLAASNGTEATTEHYSIRLGFPVREAAVRRFKEAWMTKNNVVAREADDGGVNDGRFYYDQQQQHTGGGQQQQQQPHQNFEGGGIIHNLQCFNPQPLSLTTSQEGQNAQTGDKKNSRRAACKVEEANHEDCHAGHSPSGQVEKTPKNESSSTAKARRSVRAGIRGHYASYDTAFKVRVGQHAAKHGLQETIKMFAKTEGIDLPESTVRGLRDKYLLNREGGDGGGDPDLPRGRPAILGKYDKLVGDCVEDLVRSGEAKLTSFLVIATAKQVLEQHDRGMLSEHGGEVELTQSWAKSFLKRVRRRMRRERVHGGSE